MPLPINNMIFGLLNGAANALAPSPDPLAVMPTSDEMAAATGKLGATFTEQNARTGALSPDQFAGRWQGMPAGALTGAVPLPRPRPAAANGGMGSDAPLGLLGSLLPDNAAPTQGAVPQSAIPANSPAGILSGAGSPPGGSLFSRIGQALHNNSNTLLAMGAGMAGAPSLGTGLSRGFSAAIPAAQQDLRLKVMNQTVQALVNRGVPQDMALMVATNPSALQQVLPRLMGAKQWELGETTDILGQKKPFLYDPVSGDTKPLSFGQQQQQQPTQAQGGAQLVRQNGHLYQRQPDGSYAAVQ